MHSDSATPKDFRLETLLLVGFAGCGAGVAAQDRLLFPTGTIIAR